MLVLGYGYGYGGHRLGPNRGNNPGLMWLSIASVLGGIGVILGAFGAHALKARLSTESLASWHTAVNYQLLHAVVLVALALFGAYTGRSIRVPAALMSVGVLLFSGSIYALVLTKQTWLGPVTPIGGTLIIVGWFSLLTMKLP